MFLVLSSFVFTIIKPLQQLEKARDAKRAHDLTQLRNALDTYYNDHNCYPSSLGENLTSNKTYIKEIPADPGTGAYYQYETDNSSCPQWNILFAKMSSQFETNSSCPLEQLSGCTPQGYNPSGYYCLLSGKIDCAYIAGNPLPTPIVPIPTPTPIFTPTPVTTPTTTIPPSPTPTSTAPPPTPTLPPCSEFFACTSSGGGTRCNSLDMSYVLAHQNDMVFYCDRSCNLACEIN